MGEGVGKWMVKRAVQASMWRGEGMGRQLKKTSGKGGDGEGQDRGHTHMGLGSGRQAGGHTGQQPCRITEKRTEDRTKQPHTCTSHSPSPDTQQPWDALPGWFDRVITTGCVIRCPSETTNHDARNVFEQLAMLCSG